MHALLPAIVALTLSGTALGNTAEVHSAPADTLVPFTILDQFDQPHARDEFAGRMAVFLWIDREGRDHLRRWARVLERRLNEEIRAGRVTLRTVAHGQGAPRLLRGMIKSKFPEEQRLWALMDWDGVFATHYAPVAGHVGILVFGPDGRLLHRAAATGLDQTVLDGVIGALDAGLATVDEPAE